MLGISIECQIVSFTILFFEKVYSKKPFETRRHFWNVLYWRNKVQNFSLSNKSSISMIRIAGKIMPAMFLAISLNAINKGLYWVSLMLLHHHVHEWRFCFLGSYIVNKYDETKLFVKSYPNICIKAALLCINWCVVAAAFYAIFFSVPNLGGDKYFNLFIISVIDYPAYLFCYVGMQRFGRKLTFIASMFSGGCCGLFIMLFRASQVHGMVTALSLAGAMCFSSCFTVIYMWTSEVFPTPIRNFSIGLW